MRRIAFIILCVAVLSGALYSQESLDAYYRFPFSLGAGFAPLSPVGGMERQAAANVFAGEARFPLRRIPSLQPFVGGGLISFDSEETAVPAVLGGALASDASLPDYDPRAVWDHSYAFGRIGLGYTSRLAREFEVGADLHAGAGRSLFTRRFVDESGEWVTVGTADLTFGAAARIGLNPSYNVSIAIQPTLAYRLGLEAMTDFDGFYFGVGFGASFRFGRDPDAPIPDVRAIQVSDLEMPAVFAAMQSVYVNEPVTTFTIENTSDQPLYEVRVLFNQPGFMDSPTQSALLPSLEPGARATVPVHASFNREVFSTNGITPLNGEIIFQYSYRNRPVEQRQSVTYDLHDRNALTWSDDRKVAAFITSSDSAIRNYASFIRSAARLDNTDYLQDSLEFAMQAYHALGSLGILYQPDPSSPFTRVQENTFLVDSVNLPRETLRSITGDCDDLTVLYNAMLESVGVESGFVTIPGHIYTAINTELDPSDYRLIHPDPAMTLEMEGSLWILVEITLVGDTSFVEAWRTGMRQWRAYAEREDLRAFYTTAASQRLYRAVGLQETDLGLQYGDPNAFLAGYRTDVERLAAEILRPALERAEERDNPRTWNQVGVLAGRLGRYQVADAAFETAVRLDRSYISPLVNQGSIAYLRGDFDAAVRAYRRAESAMQLNPDRVPDDAAVSIYLNLSRVLYEVNEFDEAARYVELAETIDAERAAGFRLAETDSEGGRASQRAADSIFFVEDTEADPAGE